MGKRSAFARVEKDFYSTIDPRAVAALLPHLAPETRYCEPYAGAGDLIAHLGAAGHVCTARYDVDPRFDGVERRCALTLGRADARGATHFITNPPWTRDLLHALIAHLSALLPTWLLFDADWAHTRQAGELMKRCRKVVSVGRLKWIPGSQHTGKDNCAWYLFGFAPLGAPRFYGRA
ncbi:hypothetical protein C8N35_11518 [Breoghania corrubedonensis]|uniref:Uncharacterized protein n=1 Tax=Breoghania corrubedonensis TaxID=665038 RepID=A0A2T5UQV5_9HYPH|nr:hypothetical protein [Breoghania corrubedonensis]PTW53898.1 hypothetical protein C8N35_11518 [Breoghania corrubedonensis]